MMSFSLRSILLLIMAIFFSMIFERCNYSEEWHIVNVNNQFSLSVPDYMKPTENLREDAVFQYSNRFRNLYVIVLEEDKKSAGKNFTSYRKDAVKVIYQYLDDPVLTDSSHVDINDLNGFETKVFGKIVNDLIYYDLMVVETDDKYYQICTWTRGPERFEKYKKDLKSILYSFKQIS